MSHASVTLDDRYARQEGRVLLSGTHALVRLPMLQYAQGSGRRAEHGLLS